MGGIVRGLDHPRALDAGRVRQRVAVGLTALAGGQRTAYQAVVAHAAVVGAVLGVGCGVAAGALLWHSFWHGLVTPGVAVGATTTLAAVLLIVPLRAVAGAFAATVSVSITALAVLFFVTAPPGVHAGEALGSGQPSVQDGAGAAAVSQASGVDEGFTQDGAALGPVVGDVTSPSPGVVFGHQEFGAPGAGRPGWEPATPCHSRVRTWPGRGDQPRPVEKGPCELRPTSEGQPARATR